jgi:hypothetical protein
MLGMVEGLRLFVLQDCREMSGMGGLLVVGELKWTTLSRQESCGSGEMGRRRRWWE